jgi:hypothetical protein
MSHEFALRFPGQSAPDFVRHLYRNVLLREPSPAEVDFHVNSMQSGGLNCVDDAVNFLNVPEFRAGVAPRLTACYAMPPFCSVTARRVNVPNGQT